MTQPDTTVTTPVPQDSATPTNAPVVVAEPSVAPGRLAYRLLTGPDDRSFCERVSAALADGYRLHGSPAATFNGERVIVAQAVVLADRVEDTGELR